jgi:hypothetical protein
VFVLGMVAVVVFGVVGGLKTKGGTGCSQIGGKWLEAYRECEAMSQDVPMKDFCQKNGGRFNGCSSPCRHQSEGRLCMAVCVQVCKMP